VARGDTAQFSGSLQQELMKALWRDGPGTVEAVRERLPEKSRGAYTTVQTVLNRLSERGLLERAREGAAIVYTPKLTEAQYLEQSLSEALLGASSEARQAALAGLVGELDEDELKAVRAKAAQVRRRRQQT
jgi:predicted transcriptional regulator